MGKSASISPAVQALLARGVVIPCPVAVEVDDAVNPERIAPGVIIHAGSRVRGSTTSMGEGCCVGSEAPATVEDCQLGAGVALKGGYFSGATFLDGASMGSAAHVRAGTLLEEQANGAHCVGFKQTVLMPFVTAGSLINFCDCLMAGGTSRRNHSEIGSSYIHFNFTPHQDKATASLIGDVPRGVLLDQTPIFLGGQGGLAGPVRIGYGCVVAAGVIYRGDSPGDGQLLGPAPESIPIGARPYDPAVYGTIDRVVRNNLMYLGNIRALDAWYRHVRSRFMSSDPFAQACYEGALGQLARIIEERVKRFAEFADKLVISVEHLKAMGVGNGEQVRARQESFVAGWPAVQTKLREPLDESVGSEARKQVLAALDSAGSGQEYLATIAALDSEAKTEATRWLQAVVDITASVWHAGQP